MTGLPPIPVSPPLPRGQPSCPACAGEGYVVRAGATWAEASVCDCVGVCPLCGGLGQRLVDREGVRRMGRCRCRMLPDRVALFNQATIPARHARSSFATWRRDVPGGATNLLTAQGWVEAWRPHEENRGLVLFGEAGRGKTHLVVGILRDLIFRHGVAARFVEFSHLLSELKAGFDEGVGEATTLLPLVRIPVLVIDELGKGRGTDWEMTIVDALVSHRYNALATTLATTNFLPAAPSGVVTVNLSTWAAGAGDASPPRAPTLGDRVGERVMSRLREMCTFAPVRGEDFRTRLM